MLWSYEGFSNEYLRVCEQSLQAPLLLYQVNFRKSEMLVFMVTKLWESTHSS